MSGLKKTEEVVINWWAEEHTAQLPPATIRRLDQNARRSIDLKIDKGESYGNIEKTVKGVLYQAHWRIIKKKKY